MKFAWPAMLWSLASLPLFIGAYLLFLSRRRKMQRRVAALRLVAESMNVKAASRHAPALLLAAAIGVLLVSAARPSVVLPVPSHLETVVLAIDVSHSMRAQDVPPTRLVAAQQAAKAFVAAQRPSTRIAIVEFSGEAMLVQPPTQDREALFAAIDALQTRDATAIGGAILASLRALFPYAALGPPVEPGSHKSGAIILLTDGQNTVGPDAGDAAALAAGRGVRIYTVGFGTPSGATVGGPGWSVHVYLDEPLLRSVAETTRGEYLHAQTADELQTVYSHLTSTLVLESRRTELTALFCAVAALVALLAGGLSLVQFARVAA